MLNSWENTWMELLLNRDYRDTDKNWTEIWKAVEKSIRKLVNMINGNRWDMVLQGIFDVPTPKYLSETSINQEKELGEIMKKAYSRFKERLLRYHENWELQKALRNNRIFWSFGDSPEKLAMNLDYYEALLHGKAQWATDWVKIMNAARVEKKGEEISQSIFTGRNQGFLVFVLRPNWPLFEDCLGEVLQENLGAIGRIEDTTRGWFTQALVKS